VRPSQRPWASAPRPAHALTTHAAGSASAAAISQAAGAFVCVHGGTNVKRKPTRKQLRKPSTCASGWNSPSAPPPAPRDTKGMTAKMASAAPSANGARYDSLRQPGAARWGGLAIPPGCSARSATRGAREGPAAEHAARRPAASPADGCSISRLRRAVLDLAPLGRLELAEPVRVVATDDPTRVRAALAEVEEEAPGALGRRVRRARGGARPRPGARGRRGGLGPLLWFDPRRAGAGAMPSALASLASRARAGGHARGARRWVETVRGGWVAATSTR
jgi:hypothetical protein